MGSLSKRRTSTHHHRRDILQAIPRNSEAGAVYVDMKDSFPPGTLAPFYVSVADAVL